ncbi:helix-turn-helix domain-containing protein [Ningiella sp. W23]|uniref:helix-turn-helix domain-containing protein n=1 Tax=Ningiella sp. W23 TaxID=3023715 RepID=UPI0037567A73
MSVDNDCDNFQVHIETSNGEFVYDGFEEKEVIAEIERPTILVNLCCDETEVAINSDVYRRNFTPKDSIIFIPSGTQIKEKFGPGGEMIMFELPEAAINECLGNTKATVGELSRYIQINSNKAIGNLARYLRNRLLLEEDSDPLDIELLMSDIQQKALSQCTSKRPSRALNHEALPIFIVRRVVDYIDQNYQYKIKLEDLANLASLSSWHFARAFKNTTGQSPYQMVIERRLQAARHMLEKTNEGISEIAFSTGFLSQSHLSDLFKRDLGITPNKYRKGHSKPKSFT